MSLQVRKDLTDSAFVWDVVLWKVTSSRLKQRIRYLIFTVLEGMQGTWTGRLPKTCWCPGLMEPSSCGRKTEASLLSASSKFLPNNLLVKEQSNLFRFLSQGILNSDVLQVKRCLDVEVKSRLNLFEKWKFFTCWGYILYNIDLTAF